MRTDGGEFAPKTRDKHVDRPVKRIGISAMQLVKDLIPGDDTARPLNEATQEIKLTARQGQRPPLIVTELPCVHVQNKPVERVAFGGCCGRRVLVPSPPQDGADARQKFPRAERFAQIIIRPDFQPDHPVNLIGFCGQHQDSGTCLRAQAAADGQPIFAGQHEIENDQVGLALSKQGIHFARIHGLGDLQPFAGQVFGHKPPDIGIVINYENVGALLAHSGTFMGLSSGHKPQMTRITYCYMALTKRYAAFRFGDMRVTPVSYFHSEHGNTASPAPIQVNNEEQIMNAVLKVLSATAIMVVGTTPFTMAETQQQKAQANYLASDANGDGALSFAEFRSLIDLNAQDGIGRSGLIKRTNRYAMVFERLDADGNAVISPAELQAAANQR